MKRLIAVAMLSCMPLAAHAADSSFKTFTTENIGRPYEPIDGDCYFASGAGIHGSTQAMFEASKEAAINIFKKAAEQLGADVLVGMDITLVWVPNSINPRDALTFSGVTVCGTLAKYLPQTTASAQ